MRVLYFIYSRYFDMRVAKRVFNTRPQITIFYEFCHGLFCGQVELVLFDVKQFLNDHEGEFVILDFQHLYNFEDADHAALHKLIKNIFGKKIEPFDFNEYFNLTYNRLVVENGHQVIIVYREKSLNGYHDFWPTLSWRTYWPKASDAKQLFQNNDRLLEKRGLRNGHISQFVLTPESGIIAHDPFNTLLFKLVMPNHNSILREISLKYPGKRPKAVNVIIADFVDLNNWMFCKVVVNLNRKLL